MSTPTATATTTVTKTLPVFGLAFAVLFVLKVAGLAGASWGLASLSWFWVFFPLLLPWIIVLIFLVVGGIVVGFVALGALLLDKRDERKRKKRIAAREAELGRGTPGRFGGQIK